MIFSWSNANFIDFKSFSLKISISAASSSAFRWLKSSFAVYATVIVWPLGSREGSE